MPWTQVRLESRGSSGLSFWRTLGPLDRPFPFRPVLTKTRPCPLCNQSPNSFFSSHSTPPSPIPNPHLHTFLHTSGEPTLLLTSLRLTSFPRYFPKRNRRVLTIIQLTTGAACTHLSDSRATNGAITVSPGHVGLTCRKLNNQSSCHVRVACFSSQLTRPGQMLPTAPCSLDVCFWRLPTILLSFFSPSPSLLLSSLFLLRFALALGSFALPLDAGVPCSFSVIGFQPNGIRVLQAR